MLYLFDLDNTLITGYMDNPDKAYHSWQVLPGRVDRLAALQGDGHDIGIVTNQAGVAFGHIAEHDVLIKLEAVADRFGFGGVIINGQWSVPFAACLPVQVCYADKRSKFPRYQDDARRKPSGQMIREAMAQYRYAPEQVTYVGDRPEDEQAAADAGVRFEWADAFFSEKGQTDGIPTTA